MVDVTLTLSDEVVDDKDAVRLRVSHNMDAADADKPITPAMRAAVTLIETYRNHGAPVGEVETVLEGMDKVVAEAPAVLNPFPGS